MKILYVIKITFILRFGATTAVAAMSRTTTGSTIRSSVSGLKSSMHAGAKSGTVVFDAHNHIHLSMEGGIPFLSEDEISLAQRMYGRKQHGARLSTEPQLQQSGISAGDGKSISPTFLSDCENDAAPIPSDHKAQSHARAIVDSLVLPIPATDESLAVKEGEMKQNAGDGSSSSSNAKLGEKDDAKRPETKATFQLGGIALMSTQPRDFPIVKSLSDDIISMAAVNVDVEIDKNNQGCSFRHVVRNYGVHPWFLKQANDDFERIYLRSGISNSADEKRFENNKDTTEYTNSDNDTNTLTSTPLWLSYLEQKLQSDPTSHVGEIGLDGARYEIDPSTNEKILISTMESQIKAFEAQMHLAANLKRSVSVHAVRCWGPLMDSLRKVKEVRSKMRKEQRVLRKEIKREMQLKGFDGFDVKAQMTPSQSYDSSTDSDLLLKRYQALEDDVWILPSKIYFHAFGGKAAIIDQLDAICRDPSKPSSSKTKKGEGQIETFYGFAPIVNFRSHKTAAVVRKVGIGRLVLESDLEEYSNVNDHLRANVEYVAEALGLDEEEVLRRTSENAKRLYGLVD